MAANRSQAFLAFEQLAANGIKEKRGLIEPAGRNTAPAIALVALGLPLDEIILVSPSDHLIVKEDAYQAAVRRAAELAAAGRIATFGIAPAYAETGYGYIEHEGETVISFREKPDAKTAEAYVSSGRYLWNSGMFFYRAKDMLAAIEAHLPALAAGLRELDDAARRGDEPSAVQRIFPTLPAVSIDHGVMEHVRGLAVVPASFGWSDIGSWLAAAELASHDAEGNAGPAGTLFVGAERNHVVDLRSALDGARRRVIALVGVRDLVVVETDDAVLILERDQAQDVKLVVEALQKRGDAELV